MFTFASNFDILADVAGWWLLMLLSLASLFPSFWANLLGPVLALPAILGIWFVDRAIAAGYGRGEPTPAELAFFFAPLILSILSIGICLWSMRRRARK